MPERRWIDSWRPSTRATLSATLNYPHVLFDFYGVGVYHNGEDFERSNANYVARLGYWHHCRWESMKIIQTGREVVHFAVEFVQCNAVGKEIERYPSVYIVTLAKGSWGNWGIQGRSVIG